MWIFTIVWFAWFISEGLLNRLLRSGNKVDKGRDKGSITFIWITILTSIFLGFLAANLIRIPISHVAVIPYFGLILIIAGMIIRFIAISSLGKMFTVDVTIRENHKIKKDGMYSIVRHPSYSGSLLSFLGFGISMNNWISLFIIFIPVFIVFIYRINIEEKILIEKFETEYPEYMKKTWRLLPWIY